MKNNQGFTPVLILIILFILVVLASAGSYYLLRQTGVAPDLPTSIKSLGKPQVSPAPIPISESDEIEVLLRELDDTNVGILDSDLDTLDSEASSL